MAVELPEQFIQRLQGQMGTSMLKFVDALRQDPVMSVRLNAQKLAGPPWEGVEAVPWCPTGYYLPQKPVYTLDPLFHAGCYYPQEASSMVLDWLVRQVCDLPEQPVVLDLCGAPGGKSTLLASFLVGKGLLVANEVIKSRATILAENVSKWGFANCVVTRSDPSKFADLTSMFDLMVVDAPCSGEGMFRKDERAIEEWSAANAEMCALRQQRILTDVWPALKQEGYLIYSTCTFNPSENEENMAWMANEAGAEVLALDVPEQWGVENIPIGAGNGLAFYPHKVRGEGFFVAVLRKTAAEKALPSAKRRDKKTFKSRPHQEVATLLNDAPFWFFQEERDGWNAFPKHLALNWLYFSSLWMSFLMVWYWVNP
ncbi:RsmB/NOP family class I SAM-dependent RNA methyltransferase [Geofilum rubicundum]|uniref:tRNA and rRNA cytosine-C5-methylases n=1 Tax=Geofilum rubicundum JCM 15548 TaxID=1236989 RepID=A0A0E9M1H1_9BACT|nr:RsmB/NOP family class I SAM-dependent RNA methyltransferase [Geofilum rubicundum]GAO31398.1 tRNA and rRNA cytosine-C5-methylases [Geofilum rubicundum JCM 15548]